MRVEWLPYGRPAAAAFRAEIAAAKGDEPLRSVTVIVPSNHVGVATRRLLASGDVGAVCGRGRGVAAVTFLTTYRLAELLAAPGLAASGRRPVSTPVIAAALRAALAEAPGVFAPVANHPATETALVATYRELRDVPEDVLDAIARTGRRAADVVRLHRRARAALRAAWYDEEDLMAAATQAPAVTEPVVVYLPQLLSCHGAALLHAVAERTEMTVVAGTTGDTRADEEVIASLARLGITTPPPPTTSATADGIRFVTTSDADDEVRGTMRAVLAAARGGAPLDRIAILYPQPEPYARLVHEHMEAAGLRVNGASVVPLSASVAGRALRGLLALPSAGFRRQEVLAWLTAAPMLHHGRDAPVAAWERVSHEAAVVSGRDDWDLRLARLAEQMDATAAVAEADPDQEQWKADRSREIAARARTLRTFVLGLIDDLDAAAAQPRRWGHHAAWAHGHLRRLIGPDDDGHDRWPETERDAATRVGRALDRLGALDTMEGPVDLDVFVRTLDVELESDLGRVGRFGDGVFVGPVSMAVGLDLDLAVVLGMVEGTFPSTVHDDSVLPDVERQAAMGALPLRLQRVERQHRALLAAMAGARAQLLCIRRGDLRRSSIRVPSRWAVDAAAARAGEAWSPASFFDHPEPWIDHVASFDGGLRAMVFPVTSQEHHLHALLAEPDGIVAVEGAESVAARGGGTFSRYDGNLAGMDVPAPDVTSATRLERWIKCPFAYLMSDILGVDEVENPEDQLEITPMVRGELIHTALERFVLAALDAPPAPDQPWSGTDRARMDDIARDVCAEYEARGLSGRPIFWRRHRTRIAADLQQFLDVDDTYRAAHRTRPVAAEMGFGIRGYPDPAVEFALPGGGVLRFRGKADRIDEGEDGALYVVDYKTGKANGFAKLTDDNPDLDGTKFQLPVYGLAARAHQDQPDAPVQADYWFVTSKEKFARRGFEVTDGVLDRVGTRLGHIVDGIAEGVFPNHPTAMSSSPYIDCKYCDPDGLGVTELQRRWQRKRIDPAMDAYASLIENGDEDA